MQLSDFFGVTAIFIACTTFLGWWLKARLDKSIGHEYDKILELFKTKNQLRLAAINERLRVHQEAYQLWREINTHLSTKEIGNVVTKCDLWWGTNCLYLEPEARKAFLIAFVRARDLEFYKTSQDPSTRTLVTDMYQEINEAGAIIERCVELPVLNEFEIAKKSA